jgi:CheY-like chemotaxis protein
MIKNMGYRTLAAGSGEEAVALFRHHSDQIDLVILDLIMPGISGSETFDRIRKIKPGVKIILASGYSIDRQANELIGRGCDGFIQKPYRLEDLSHKIDALLKKGTA